MSYEIKWNLKPLRMNRVCLEAFGELLALTGIEPYFGLERAKYKRLIPLYPCGFMTFCLTICT
jgi:hypothetical protein